MIKWIVIGIIKWIAIGIIGFIAVMDVLLIIACAKLERERSKNRK